MLNNLNCYIALAEQYLTNMITKTFIKLLA